MDALTPLLMGAAAYVAPALLAVLVRHRERWLIAIITVLFGWTVIGWFSAWHLLFLPLTL
jgi:CHASE2 domain-containing sensor protein